jgi:NitT/TauT family transport system permease protein
VKNPDTRTCEQYAYQSLLLQDTLASLYRIAVGVGMAAIVGLFIGIHLALYNGFRSTMNPIITFLSIVPPLALMPILLITMGTGDVAKIALIFIGTVFTISRDVYRATNEIPNEQITKALTLGAKEWEVVYKIVLPQIIPSLLETVRLSLGAAWLFLIAGEAVASQDGLGFRIYLVKRYMDMSAIIPYVLVITALGFLMDYLLRRFVYWRFPWYVALKGDKK